MTDERIGLLYKIASSIPNAQSETQTLLKCYFLMKCNGITKNLGPLKKMFSSELRCSHCCNEWKNGSYETEIKPVKMSKKQRIKIKATQSSATFKDACIESSLNPGQTNKMERTCLLCKKKTVIPMLKPIMHESVSKVTIKPIIEMAENNIKKAKPKTIEIKKNPEINVYCNSKDVFSLQNKSNTITSTIKQSSKIIKNNKKKKDKFAGLCREAVAASLNISKEKQSQNKLNLFLKPLSS